MEFTQEHEGIRRDVRRHSRAGGNPCHCRRPTCVVFWIPASAGMTS
jgi:hypothetical protein